MPWTGDCYCSMIVWRWLETTGVLAASVVLASSAYLLTQLGLVAASSGTLSALDAALRVALLGYLPLGTALGVIYWRNRARPARGPRLLVAIRWMALAVGTGALVDGAARLIVAL